MASRLLSSRVRRAIASSTAGIEQRCIIMSQEARWQRGKRAREEFRRVTKSPQPGQRHVSRLFSTVPEDLKLTSTDQTLSIHHDTVSISGEIPSHEGLSRSEQAHSDTSNEDHDADDMPLQVLLGLDRSLVQYLSDKEHLEELVSKIESRSNLSSTEVESWVHPLMLATSKLDSFDGAVLTERLLAKCLDLVGEEEQSKLGADDELPYPSAEMYNMAISAWTHAGTSDGPGAERASLLLELMSEEYRRERVRKFNQDNKGEARQVHSPRPDIINYTTVMNAWAKSGTRAGILRAQQMLDELEQLSGVSQVFSETKQENTERHLAYLTPDQACYNAVITGWARSSYPEAILRVEWLLQRMDMLYERTGDNRFKPNTQSFHMLINAYAKTAQQQRGKKGNQASLQAAQKAENVLRTMQERYQEATSQGLEATADDDSVIARPDVIACNAAINAWANSASPEGPHRAESILLAMLGIAKDNDFPALEGIFPNAITFNTVIHAWARSGNIEAGERAEKLLELMESFASDDDELHPNTITFNALMNAWSRSKAPDAGERAEAILDHMLESGGDAHPNAISFSTAIFAWARCDAEEGAQRAELLLERMEALHTETGDKSLRPNEACYDGVISAWTQRSGSARRYEGLYAAERAELALERMEEVGEIAAGTKHYNRVLNAWRKHQNDAAAAPDADPNKVKRARSLLQKMSGRPSPTATEEEPATRNSNSSMACPDVFSYNYLIAACASPVRTAERRREAFFTALDAYNRLCGSQTSYPNNHTYRMMFDVCTELLPNTSDAQVELVERLFQECCNDGFLSNDIIKTARECLPPWSMQKFIGPKAATYGNKPIYVSDLPREWSRNFYDRRPQR